MAEEYILRYFPNSICPEGFGKKGRKGVGSVTLDRLEMVAERLERERVYDNRGELSDRIIYTFRKGDVINCSNLEGHNEVFTLSADVHVEIRKMKDVPYGGSDYATGHVNKGVREALVVRNLRSLSELSLINTAYFRLGLPVDSNVIERVGE